VKVQLYKKVKGDKIIAILKPMKSNIQQSFLQVLDFR